MMCYSGQNIIPTEVPVAKIRCYHDINRYFEPPMINMLITKHRNNKKSKLVTNRTETARLPKKVKNDAFIYGTVIAFPYLSRNREPNGTIRVKGSDRLLANLVSYRNICKWMFLALSLCLCVQIASV